jgi:hypothetical protein
LHRGEIGKWFQKRRSPRRLRVKRATPPSLQETVPAASQRDEHEFFPVRHLMTRLNPKLQVKQVATGVHVDGGCTVFWGLVYGKSQSPSMKTVEIALREAGFDFAHNVLTQATFVRTDHAEDGKTRSNGKQRSLSGRLRRLLGWRWRYPDTTTVSTESTLVSSPCSIRISP